MTCYKFCRSCQAVHEHSDNDKGKWFWVYEWIDCTNYQNRLRAQQEEDAKVIVKVDLRF